MVNTTERAMVSGLAERGSPKVVSPMINSAMVDICEIRRYFTWFSTYLYCQVGNEQRFIRFTPFPFLSAPTCFPTFVCRSILFYTRPVIRMAKS